MDGSRTTRPLWMINRRSRLFDDYYWDRGSVESQRACAEAKASQRAGSSCERRAPLVYQRANMPPTCLQNQTSSFHRQNTCTLPVAIEETQYPHGDAERPECFPVIQNDGLVVTERARVPEIHRPATRKAATGKRKGSRPQTLCRDQNVTRPPN